MLPYLTLILMLLLGGIAAAGAAIAIMALSLLRPPRMTDGKALWVLRRVSPLDVGLAYEDMNFTVRDEQTGKPLKIAGWWIPHASAGGRSVVMIHGYADAKIGSMAWAPLWHRLGYNILAIDLRAHGESEGVYSTAGCFEQHDVSQVIDQLREKRPEDSGSIVLFGVSLGAMVAASVAAMRDDISAVVLDSPLAQYFSTAMIHMDRLGAPSRVFQEAALRLAQRIAHADFSEAALDKVLPLITAPVMVALADQDMMISPTDRDKIIAAMEIRRSAGREADLLWSAADTTHLNALHNHPQEYEQHLREFLNNQPRFSNTSC